MIRVEITSDTTAEIHTGHAAPQRLEVPATGDIQDKTVDHLLTMARRDGQTLSVEIDGPERTILTVHPDGTIQQGHNATADPQLNEPELEAVEQSNSEPVHDVAQPLPEHSAAAATDAKHGNVDVTPTEPSPTLPSRKSLRDTTFLVTEIQSAPATKGWRGTLNKLGLRLEPSEEETAEREDIRAVSQHWPGPRTIAVVNRKGGANKTPTVAMLSAVLARYGGGPVVAWDNNESQGTLGWRTEQGAHDSSVLHLIAAADKLLSPSANAADLAHYVHHQTADKFDVLRSDENDEGDHEITAEEVDIAHRVLSKFYRLLVMDSGNTARSANWRRMIDHTSQLVVPVTAMEDRAEAARLTLQTLESRGGHNAELAHNAVVIVSEATDAARGTGDALKRSREEAARIAEGFKPLVRDVVRVPYDPALVNGIIRYDALRPQTQRAWLAAAAAVTKGF
jgi:MinD-like ATPase involved in chromosome partitioning or flagellar assembly